MDREQLTSFILGCRADRAHMWFELFKDPLWKPALHLPEDKQQKKAFKRMKQVSKKKLISVFDFQNDVKNVFLAHEMLTYMDASVAVKTSAHYNLVAGSIMNLKSGNNEALLKEMDKLKQVGVFALTELGFGNNNLKMETTFTYDHSTQEFIVHSPSPLSRKAWMANTVRDGTLALVMGQTIVNAKNEGIHAFLVPIRDAYGRIMPGVSIFDLGRKMSVNGIDNGYILFDQVRIPKDNILDKVGFVNEYGQYSSDIADPKERFFKVIDKLVSGRLCITSTTIAGSRMCLYITIKYSQKRLGQGPTGYSDTPIWSYQLQQNSLMPLLAKTICVNMAYNKVKEIYSSHKYDNFEFYQLCTCVKVMSGYHFVKLANECRERCGAQGMLERNRIGDNLVSGHVALTGEGDNRMLNIKLVKDLIRHVAKDQGQLPGKDLLNQKDLQGDRCISQLEVLRALISYRVAKLFVLLTDKIAHWQTTKHLTLYDIFSFKESDLIQKLASALQDYHAFTLSINQLEYLTGKNLEVMKSFIQIYGLEVVKMDLDFFYSHEAVTLEKGKQVGDLFNDLIKQNAQYANEIVDSFSIPVHALFSPLVGDYILEETSIHKL